MPQCKHTYDGHGQCHNNQTYDYCYHHMPKDYVFNSPHYRPIKGLMDDPRYKEGKIYIMYHKDEPYVRYIGSTVKSLEYRLKRHEYDSKRVGSGKKKNDHFNHYGWRGAKIELIADAPCNNRTELEVIEQHYIRKLEPELNHTWNC